ncbi:MAG: hypothetical protein ACE5JX_17020 [Acidobacteriota bacterium]
MSKPKDLSTLYRIFKKLKRAQDIFASFEESLDALIWEFKQELERLGVDCSFLDGSSRRAGRDMFSSPPVRGGSREFRLFLKSEAQEGADTLSFLPTDAAGNVVISLDKRLLSLPPKLGALLQALATDKFGIKSADGLAPWKTKGQIASAMTKLGQPVKENNVANLVYRLRKEFKSGGLNPFLIQTKANAYRLALGISANPL